MSIRPSVCWGGVYCGCLVFLVVGVGVLFAFPSTIDGGCRVSCLWPGWLKFEGVVVVVCVIVRDESGEVGVLVYVEYGYGVEEWVG